MAALMGEMNKTWEKLIHDIHSPENTGQGQATKNNRDEF